MKASTPELSHNATAVAMRIADHNKQRDQLHAALRLGEQQHVVAVVAQPRKQYIRHIGRRRKWRRIA